MQQQFIGPSGSSPIISETPLGWTLIGTLPYNNKYTNENYDSEEAVQQITTRKQPNPQKIYNHSEKQDELKGYSQEDITF